MYDADLEPDTFAEEKTAAKAARAAALPDKRAARARAATEVAAELALAMRRVEGAYVLPAELLFSTALLAANGRPGRGNAFLRFQLDGAEPVDFERTALARVAAVLRRRSGVRVELLDGWLRFRFGAKGRLDVPARLRALPAFDDVVVVAPPVAVARPVAAVNDNRAA